MRIDDQYWNLDSVRSCVVTICTRPHFSGKPGVLAWVRNPVITILHNFPVAASLAMASIYLGVVALSLQMTLNKSPFNLRESPVMFCVQSFAIRVPHSYFGHLLYFCLHQMGTHGGPHGAIWHPVSGRVVNLDPPHLDS